MSRNTILPALLLALAGFQINSYGQDKPAPESAPAAAACSPEYKVEYNSCVRPESPTQVQRAMSDWVLVNEGADVVTDGLCTESGNMEKVKNKYPQATHIDFDGGSENIKTKDSLSRNIFSGVGKHDVYCRYVIDTPVAVPIADPACGIKDVVRHGCADKLTLDFVKTCVNQTPQTEEELWTQATCLIDSFKQAPRIQGMDQNTWDQIQFKLDMMEKSLSRSASPQERRLADMILSETSK
jgi:hypothetical protein